MLKNEAGWLRAELARLPTTALTPLLSIGSGTRATRSRQPWIDELVFDPIVRSGVEVLHHERFEGPGIDIAGDLDDASFAQELASLGIRSVICCNVFEHLPDPAAVAATLSAAIAPESYLVVTVPRRYPYHPDPIDTMFRPSVTELAALVPELHLVVGEDVPCGTLLSYALSVRGKREMVGNAARALLAPLTRPERTADRDTGDPIQVPPSREGPARYLVSATSVTCAVFARPG